jgi:hypothetical protein
MATIIPTLTESNLFILARSKNLLAFLGAEINVQMAVELKIDEIFPREPDDNDDTRVLINFTTASGKSSSYKLNDNQRLGRRFDVDKFMSGFVEAVSEAEAVNPAMDQVDANILAALNMAVNIKMELTNGSDITNATKVLADSTLFSLVSIVYNDPLDAIIHIEERKPEEGEEQGTAVITGMWAVKQRKLPEPTVVEHDTVQ